jgi:hypothetical protein
LPASLIAGWGWERFGHVTPFVFGAVMAFVAYMVLGIRDK